MALTSQSITAIGASASIGPPTFTCQLCDITFQDSTSQRSHMKSAWHVYNLKRHLSQLGPIGLQRFEGLESQKTQQKAEYSDDLRWRCSVCQNDYQQEKLYKNHLRSVEHLERLAFLDGEIEQEADNAQSSDVQQLANVASRLEAFDISDVSSDDEQSTNDEEDDLTADYASFDELACIFCSQQSSDLQSNLSHMYDKHGLFIQWPEYVAEDSHQVDYLNSLYIYIHRFFGCINCGTQKASLKAVITHMTAKGHSNVTPQDVTEFFEDFWESDDGPRGSKAKDAGTIVELQGHDENTFILPSGKKISNNTAPRARQIKASAIRAQRRLLTEREEADEEDVRTSEESTKAGDRDQRVAVRKSDQLGLIGLSLQQKRDLMIAEKKMMKAEIRARNQYRGKLEKAANKTKQMHFRPDGPGPSNG